MKNELKILQAQNAELQAELKTERAITTERHGDLWFRQSYVDGICAQAMNYQAKWLAAEKRAEEAEKELNRERQLCKENVEAGYWLLKRVKEAEARIRLLESDARFQHEILRYQKATERGIDETLYAQDWRQKWETQQRELETAEAQVQALREALEFVVETWPKRDENYYRPDHEDAVEKAREALAAVPAPVKKEKQD